MKKKLVNAGIILSLPYIFLLRFIGICADLVYILLNVSKIKDALAELTFFENASLHYLERCMRKDYAWKGDNPEWLDYPKLPLATVINRGGDCEDFVRLYARATSHRFEFHAFTVVTSWKSAHAMGIIVDGDSYHICSNRVNFEVKADSIDDAMVVAAKLWNRKYKLIVKCSRSWFIPLRCV